MKKIKIKYFGDVKRLKQTKIGDWIDLFAADDVFIEEGASGCIPLGVAMELPEGYEAIISPRSSMYATWGIIQTNSIGVIDEMYKGDNDQWMLPVLCENAKCVHNNRKGTIIKKGDKICQFRIVEHQPQIVFEEVEHLDNPDRNGFGSTGTR